MLITKHRRATKDLSAMTDRASHDDCHQAAADHDEDDRAPDPRAPERALCSWLLGSTNATLSARGMALASAARARTLQRVLGRLIGAIDTGDAAEVERAIAIARQAYRTGAFEQSARVAADDPVADAVADAAETRRIVEHVRACMQTIWLSGAAAARLHPDGPLVPPATDAPSALSPEGEIEHAIRSSRERWTSVARKLIAADAALDSVRIPAGTIAERCGHARDEILALQAGQQQDARGPSPRCARCAHR
jgi:hypothetical protein